MSDTPPASAACKHPTCWSITYRHVGRGGREVQRERLVCVECSTVVGDPATMQEVAPKVPSDLGWPA